MRDRVQRGLGSMLPIEERPVLPMSVHLAARVRGAPSADYERANVVTTPAVWCAPIIQLLTPLQGGR
jgi:hypothetical protein